MPSARARACRSARTCIRCARWHVALGLGAELIRTSGSKTLEPDDRRRDGRTDHGADAFLGVLAADVVQFRHAEGMELHQRGSRTRDGSRPSWKATRSPRRRIQAADRQLRRGRAMVLEGARGLSFDIRFYAINPQEATLRATTTNGRPAYTRRANHGSSPARAISFK